MRDFLLYWSAAGGITAQSADAPQPVVEHLQQWLEQESNALSSEWTSLPEDDWQACIEHIGHHDVIHLRSRPPLSANLTAAQITQMEKLASVGLLAAGVAHEINNPVGFVSANLNTLKTYCSELLAAVAAYQRVDPTVLSASLSEDDKVLLANTDFDYLQSDLKDLIDESVSGLQRVIRIIQLLKDFSRSGGDEFAEVDVHQCIESTLNIINNEIKYKATVVKTLNASGTIRGLENQLNQVFTNLLVNASHAIKEKGQITVATRDVDDGIEIEIGDNGVGISEENMKRIFEPFFTTKPVGVGTGLGLSVSHDIVQKHHGSIAVRSEVGKGTVFSVWLPRTQKNNPVQK